MRLRLLNPEPLLRLLLKLLCRIVYFPYYEGFHALPAKGPAILVSNHVSYADGLIIATGCKRPVRFVIDQDIYQLPIVHYLMRLNRAIPIAPTRASVTHALEEISQGLKKGDVICIFPEGQITYTGALGRFKTGIEAIIKRDPVPVYPIALIGLWGSMFSRKYRGSFKRLIPKNPLRRVRIICGKEIAPEMVNVNYLQEVVLRLKYQQR